MVNVNIPKPVPNARKVRCTISLDSETLNTVRAIADDSDVSISHAVVHMIDTYLANNVKKTKGN